MLQDMALEQVINNLFPRSKSKRRVTYLKLKSSLELVEPPYKNKFDIDICPSLLHLNEIDSHGIPTYFQQILSHTGILGNIRV